MERMYNLIERAFRKVDDMEPLTKMIAEALESSKQVEEVKTALEEVIYSIPLEEAETIVRRMQPFGQVWSFNQVKDFIKGQGITENCINWYLVMNMVYNDYYNTAKEFGLQNDDKFYFSLAKDFMFDEDAEPFKVEKYFE